MAIKHLSIDNLLKYSFYLWHSLRDLMALSKYKASKVTYIQLFHCSWGHVSVFKIYEGTKTLVQHSDAFDFSIAGTTRGRIESGGKIITASAIEQSPMRPRLQSHFLKRSRRCFSVSSVVTLPTQREGQGLLRWRERDREIMRKPMRDTCNMHAIRQYTRNIASLQAFVSTYPGWRRVESLFAAVKTN